MSREFDIVWGRVSELGAYEGGARLRAMLVPEDDGPPIRLELKSPPRDLSSAITLGARVGCRTYTRDSPRGFVQVAFWIDAVERRDGRKRWAPVWKAPTDFEPRGQSLRDSPPGERPEDPARRDQVDLVRLDGGSLLRRRGVAPPQRRAPAEGKQPERPAPPERRGGERAPLPVRSAPRPRPERGEPRRPETRQEDRRERPTGKLVEGTVVRLQRMPDMRTEGTIATDDGGPPVLLRLRRAPKGLLDALVPGARVRCFAIPHANDSGARFSARVQSVAFPDADGVLREAWRHDPSRERGAPCRTPPRERRRRGPAQE